MIIIGKIFGFNNKSIFIYLVLFFNTSINSFSHPVATYKSEPIPFLQSGINEAIKNSNSFELAKYFSNSLELILPNNSGTYSKNQAEIIIKNFFNNNKAKSYSITQEGKKSSNQKFVIADYITTNNIKFRVYYVVSIYDNNEQIILLQFEKR